MPIVAIGGVGIEVPDGRVTVQSGLYPVHAFKQMKERAIHAMDLFGAFEGGNVIQYRFGFRRSVSVYGHMKPSGNIVVNQYPRSAWIAGYGSGDSGDWAMAPTFLV